MRATGKTLEQVLDDLANRSGLLGLSGYNDLRDIEEAAANGGAGVAAGHRRVRRRRCGTTSARICCCSDGADAIVFTGGIGENSSRMRAAVCADLDWFGIAPRPAPTNDGAKGEAAIHARGSRVQIVDHADQRGAGRRPAGEGAAGRASNGARRSCSWRSHRQRGGDAESRLDDGPQAADRRAAARSIRSSATAWSAPAAPSSWSTPWGGPGRDGADRAGLERPPDARDREAAGRRDHHRHRGHASTSRTKRSSRRGSKRFTKRHREHKGTQGKNCSSLVLCALCVLW